MAGLLPRAWNLVKFQVSRRVHGYDVPSEPHFDDESTAWFRTHLAKSSAYLEFGSGGSTLLADKLGIASISVENDGLFAAAVREQLDRDTRVVMKVVSIGLTGPWGVPIPGKPNPARVARWLHYVDAPFDQLTETSSFPDLVLIDGRFRRACALEVTRRAQARGASATIMFDDYYCEGHAGYDVVEKHLGPPVKVGRAAIFDTGNAQPVDRASVIEAAHDFH